MEPTDREVARFWRKVRPGDECWIWTGARHPFGYGLTTIGGRQQRAHRVSYALWYGPIPEGLKVCHRCDNPPCVRPDHLFLGTQRENMADMTAKGRRVGPIRRDLRPTTSLTVTDVAYIRAMGLAGYYEREIADRFGVSQGNISHILLGHTWPGVEPSAPLPTVERFDYRHKLSPDIARAIRADYTGKRGDVGRLAAQFGVSLPTISTIIAGRSYPET